MKRLQHLIEWLALVVARAGLACLPLRAAVEIGAAFGDLAYLLGIRRRVVFENLAVAFPDWDMAQRRRVARRSYRNMGRAAVECLLLGSIMRRRANCLFTAHEGDMRSAEMIRNQEPFIAATGHVGNWELGAVHWVRQGCRLKVLAKPMHNPRVERTLSALRQAGGYGVIYVGDGLKPAVRHLNEGGILAILADQDARRQGIAVPFFGRPASTALGPAVLSRLARAPIVPFFAYRVGPMEHRSYAFPPIPPPTREEGRAGLERATLAHVQALEQFIRRHPDQYFWFHRRWKTPAEKLARGEP